MNIEQLMKLDWYPGSIALELELYAMTHTPVYKEEAKKQIEQACKAWFIAYDGATPRERRFYKQLNELL